MLKVGFLFTYIAPLLLVLGFTMLKEAYDDINRKKRDEETNTQKYTAIRNTGREEVLSMNIKVGDIVEVKSNQRIPADMVILSTEDPDGTVFIRTDQLDGETDWKLRKAIKKTHEYSKTHSIHTLSASVEAEAPKLDIYHFEGLFKTQNAGVEA
jgi:phospholipid-translocating ATPase